MSDPILIIVILCLLTVMFVMLVYICIHVCICTYSKSTDTNTLHISSIDDFLNALHRTSINEDSGITRTNTTSEL